MSNNKDSLVSISGGPNNVLKAMTEAVKSGQHAIIEAGLNLPEEFGLDDPTIKKIDSQRK